MPQGIMDVMAAARMSRACSNLSYEVIAMMVIAANNGPPGIMIVGSPNSSPSLYHPLFLSGGLGISLIPLLWVEFHVWACQV